MYIRVNWDAQTLEYYGPYDKLKIERWDTNHLLWSEYHLLPSRFKSVDLPTTKHVLAIGLLRSEYKRISKSKFLLDIL